MEEEQNETSFLANNEYLNSNESLTRVVTKLENIINDINNKKESNTIIEQIKEIIASINNIINENKKNIKQIKKEIINIIGETKTKTYKNG